VTVSVPHGLFKRSSVDAVWAAATAAANRNRISSTQSPDRLTYPQSPVLCPPISVSESDHQALSAGPGRDRDKCTGAGR